ncbi:MAG: hypothetical protein MJA83_04610, partial [Gammaproteobacteria bacterium]|nr:hypothetical protein [Gammaproteobacteria bacterium]
MIFQFNITAPGFKQLEFWVHEDVGGTPSGIAKYSNNTIHRYRYLSWDEKELIKANYYYAKFKVHYNDETTEYGEIGELSPASHGNETIVYVDNSPDSKSKRIQITKRIRTSASQPFHLCSWATHGHFAGDVSTSEDILVWDRKMENDYYLGILEGSEGIRWHKLLVKGLPKGFDPSAATFFDSGPYFGEVFADQNHGRDTVLLLLKNTFYVAYIKKKKKKYTLT